MFDFLRNAVNLADFDRIDTHPDNGGTFYGKDDGEGTPIGTMRTAILTHRPRRPNMTMNISAV